MNMEPSEELFRKVRRIRSDAARIAAEQSSLRAQQEAEATQKVADEAEKQRIEKNREGRLRRKSNRRAKSFVNLMKRYEIPTVEYEVNRPDEYLNGRGWVVNDSLVQQPSIDSAQSTSKKTPNMIILEDGKTYMWKTRELSNFRLSKVTADQVELVNHPYAYSEGFDVLAQYIARTSIPLSVESLNTAPLSEQEISFRESDKIAESFVATMTENEIPTVDFLTIETTDQGKIFRVKGQGWPVRPVGAEIVHNDGSITADELGKIVLTDGTTYSWKHRVKGASLSEGSVGIELEEADIAQGLYTSGDGMTILNFYAEQQGTAFPKRTTNWVGRPSNL